MVLVFNPRPWAGGRLWKPPPAPFGQTRAICPNRPHVCIPKLNITLKVDDNQTYVALLVWALNPKAWAFCLNMAYTCTRVTLFRCDRTRLCATWRLMAWLTTIVAKTLLGWTSLSDVSHWQEQEKMTLFILSQEPYLLTISALKATLPRELIRHLNAFRSLKIYDSHSKVHSY